MVDRDVLDECQRQRAVRGGAERRTGTFTPFARGDDGIVVLTDTDGTSRSGETRQVRARMVVGADGALSPIARQCVPRAPIPIKRLPCWDNGRDVVLAGDAAGVVAPASGEGILYAMTGGRFAAQAVEEAMAAGKVKALRSSRSNLLQKSRASHRSRDRVSLRPPSACKC